MNSTKGLRSNTSADRSVATSWEMRALNEKEARGCLLILDERALDRECLASALLDHEIGMTIVAMHSIEEWRFNTRPGFPLMAVLLNLGGQKVTDNGVADEIKRISSEFMSVPVVVLADTEDLAQILAALECGARGYIPTSVGVDVCIEAVNLAAAGGTFVPASSVMSIRHLLNPGSRDALPLTLKDMFTLRQAEVAEALRRGKANKIIAYELNLRESTVKVHIRNIMRKLKATNRTEVAYKVNDLLADGKSG
ncbi:LuxR C-terminal-related transcriptional regulator [Mesorhizobium sp. B1-1-8]|uniref:LuxR C-terminal-related transcriptional regulator n=1 Tax=Mesorhizobium sp. B1-1-8 TaxID=2589976 RepID=UPI0039B0280F